MFDSVSSAFLSQRKPIHGNTHAHILLFSSCSASDTPQIVRRFWQRFLKLYFLLCVRTGNVSNCSKSMSCVQIRTSTICSPSCLDKLARFNFFLPQWFDLLWIILKAVVGWFKAISVPLGPFVSGRGIHQPLYPADGWWLRLVRPAVGFAQACERARPVGWHVWGVPTCGQLSVGDRYHNTLTQHGGGWITDSWWKEGYLLFQGWWNTLKHYLLATTIQGTTSCVVCLAC